MALETGVRIGKYEIGRKLGQGGFAILYAARDHELGRDIAIKFLRPEHVFRPQVLQRFLQEARAAARINHPGIVTVFESGEVTGTNTRADGTVFIAMELLGGTTLAHRLKQSGTMPYRLALGFCRQLATALAAAHASGIVHRDLKPQNIFLVPDAAVLGGERVKVLDFGIAKLVDDMGSALNTQSMLMLGTPMYMSPEQCKSSARVDARSDIYSLGCILFEMVCGNTPFAGDSGELIAKHQLVDPPSARQVNPALPIVLDQLITSMLAKNPDDRPQTMAAVLDVLEECDYRSVEPPTMPDHVPLRDTTDQPTPSTTTLSEAAAKPKPARTKLWLAIAAPVLVVIGIAVGFYAAPGDSKPAPVAAAPQQPPSERAKDLKLVCLQAQLEKRWDALHSCGEQLAPIESDEGGKFVVMAEAERDNEAALRRLQDALRKTDREAAKTALDEIEEASVYYALAKSLYAGAPVPAPAPPVVALSSQPEETAPPEEPKPAPQKSSSRKERELAPPLRKEPKKTAEPARRAETLVECDANGLKEEGMQNINMGQHAAALAKFEASLRCRKDPYVIQLAFMESCASSNSPKAKTYYKQMTAAQQAKFGQMCIRNKVAFE
jgi:serine/threonine protein kinase